jgi:aspartate kinase
MALETLPPSPTTNGHAQMKKNDASGGWVIQKFGGTSVGKFAEKIAEDIVR